MAGSPNANERGRNTWVDSPCIIATPGPQQQQDLANPKNLKRRNRVRTQSNTRCSSPPLRSTSSAQALGLTHTQSTPGGGGRVPFVSIAISNPALCKAAVRGSSSCSRGSPPVHTTKRGAPGAAAAGQAASTARASASLEANRPPPGPSVSTKSVSQKPHRAVARSSSRPDHRLQPENRNSTAGRPA